MPDDFDAQAEVGKLWRTLDRIGQKIEGPLGGDKLAEVRLLVADVAEELAALAKRVDELEETGKRQAVVSLWELLDEGAGALQAELDDIHGWLRAVFLRYPWAAASLPPCWVLHPWMVEELAWLRRAWRDAYHGPGASGAKAGEWHDRHLPGFVGRLRDNGCSAPQHVPGPDGRAKAGRATPHVPLGGLIPAVAEVLAADPYAAMPQPTDDDLAEAKEWRK